MSIKADWIVSLRTLAEVGSLKSAARRLGIDRTTVTRHLQWIEFELGTSVVDRKRRPWRLTAAGTEIIAADDRRELAIQRVSTDHKRVNVDHGSMVRIMAPAALLSGALQSLVSRICGGTFQFSYFPADTFTAADSIAEGLDHLVAAYAHEHAPCPLPSTMCTSLPIAQTHLELYCHADQLDQCMRRLMDGVGPPIPLATYSNNVYLARPIEFVTEGDDFRRAFKVIAAAPACAILSGAIAPNRVAAFLPTFFASTLPSSIISVTRALEASSPSMMLSTVKKLRLPIKIMLARPSAVANRGLYHRLEDFIWQAFKDHAEKQRLAII